jgi:hypothetical protein
MYIEKHPRLPGLLFMTVGIFFLTLWMFMSAGEAAYWYEWQKQIVRELMFFAAPLFLTGFLSLIMGVALLYSAEKTLVVK